MSIEVLLFDLGGVLVDFSGVRDLMPRLPAGTTEHDVKSRFSSCPHVTAYGNGRITRQDFGERFVREWGLTITPEQFLREFKMSSRCLLPGAEDLLAALRGRFRLAALSNTNELHWERNTHEIGITQQFEVAIASHEVGVSKPDPAIYRIALERLGVAAGAVMFFDDIQANVDAASALGMHAFQVDGVEGVRERLVREGVL